VYQTGVCPLAEAGCPVGEAKTESPQEQPQVVGPRRFFGSKTSGQPGSAVAGITSISSLRGLLA
jgi:hypothetical protein